MGCDIHWIIEKKKSAIRGDSSEGWVGVAIKYHTPNLPIQTEIPAGFNTYSRPVISDRHYGFFAALAGVRGDGPYPRGLPNDLSDLARMDIDDYGADGHSHSWATLREFIMTWLKTSMPQVHDEMVADLATARLGDQAIPSETLARLAFYTGISWVSELDDYRVVYFFDN